MRDQVILFRGGGEYLNERGSNHGIRGSLLAKSCFSTDDLGAVPAPHFQGLMLDFERRVDSDKELLDCIYSVSLSCSELHLRIVLKVLEASAKFQSVDFVKHLVDPRRCFLLLQELARHN